MLIACANNGSANDTEEIDGITVYEKLLTTTSSLCESDLYVEGQTYSLRMGTMDPSLSGQQVEFELGKNKQEALKMLKTLLKFCDSDKEMKLTIDDSNYYILGGATNDGSLYIKYEIFDGTWLSREDIKAFISFLENPK